MSAPSIAALGIRIFADGADLATIQKAALDPRIQGFTTNPTLMHKAGNGNVAGIGAIGIMLALLFAMKADRS